MKLPKVKLPVIKKTGKHVSRGRVSETVEEEDVFNDLPDEFDELEEPFRVMPKPKLPKLPRINVNFSELDEALSRKIWAGEIGFAIVIAFASVLIGFAG